MNWKEGGNIKKFIFFFICAIVTFVIITGCSNSENTNEFIAIVLENNESSLLVEPEEGSDELNSADQILVSVKNAALLSSQDRQITISDIKTGKKVQITYNGVIAESYPAQIKGCYRVRLLD